MYVHVSLHAGNRASRGQLLPHHCCRRNHRRLLGARSRHRQVHGRGLTGWVVMPARRKMFMSAPHSLLSNDTHAAYDWIVALANEE